MMSSRYQNAKYYRADLYGLDAIEQSIAQLIKHVSYISDNEKQQLIDCCFFAAIAHEGQKRRSGEPYICHPIKVAEILAKEVRFDLPVLSAAVLHDVIEDTPTCKEEIVDVFGQEVADLVDGVSKLEKDKDISPQELQARTFAKLVHAMEADPRVVMIKFADRMHNMQTLDALRPDKRRRIAEETLDVYVPIATRLGMYIFKTQLEELAFKHVNPWRYRTIEKLLNDNEVREMTAQAVSKKINEESKAENINIILRRRRRNLYNIYKKLEKIRFSNRRPLENASIPFIVLTDCIEDCYRILGLIHQIYAPVFNKLNDYIASPKANGYQSIHTSVLTPDRRVLNFQIRTKEMHAVAEAGLVAIWRYHNESNHTFGIKGLPKEKIFKRWLGSIKTTSTQTQTPIEFYEAVKQDLTGYEVQVLTPKGEPVALPKGATVIDFAYYIHSDLGNHLYKAKVNGVEVDVDFKLKAGQTVEIFTQTATTPQSSWLGKIVTARARACIKHYLRELPEKELAAMGLQEFKAYLLTQNVRFRQLEKMLKRIAQRQYESSKRELLQRIALHEIGYEKILYFLQRLSRELGKTAMLSLVAYNQPGVLAKIAEILGYNGANIYCITFPDNTRSEETLMVFEIQVESAKDLQLIVDELTQLNLVKYITHEEK